MVNSKSLTRKPPVQNAPLANDVNTVNCSQYLTGTFCLNNPNQSGMATSSECLNSTFEVIQEISRCLNLAGVDVLTLDT